MAPTPDLVQERNIRSQHEILVYVFAPDITCPPNFGMEMSATVACTNILMGHRESAITS